MAGKDNIVLIGMPGAGKSTLGIVLAKIMSYDFIDADLVIQNQCDKTLQKIIDACGPEGFIEVENEVLRDLSASRSVIATGGRPSIRTRPCAIWPASALLCTLRYRTTSWSIV